jgi:predicted LPLAT superfamily acyltransferase
VELERLDQLMEVVYRRAVNDADVQCGLLAAKPIERRSSKQYSDRDRPLQSSEYLASWINRSRHLHLFEQASAFSLKADAGRQQSCRRNPTPFGV